MEVALLIFSWSKSLQKYRCKRRSWSNWNIKVTQMQTLEIKPIISIHFRLKTNNEKPKIRQFWAKKIKIVGVA